MWLLFSHLTRHARIIVHDFIIHKHCVLFFESGNPIFLFVSLSRWAYMKDMRASWSASMMPSANATTNLASSMQDVHGMHGFCHGWIYFYVVIAFYLFVEIIFILLLGAQSAPTACSFSCCFQDLLYSTSKWVQYFVDIFLTNILYIFKGSLEHCWCTLQPDSISINLLNLSDRQWWTVDSSWHWGKSKWWPYDRILCWSRRGAYSLHLFRPSLTQLKFTATPLYIHSNLTPPQIPRVQVIILEKEDESKSILDAQAILNFVEIHEKTLAVTE